MALFDPAIFDPAIFDAGGGGTPTAYTLEITPASYSLSGNSTSLIARQLVNVTPASYSLTGNTASLINRQVMNVTPGSYALSGNTAALTESSVLGVTPGSYSLAGSPVDLTYSTVSARVNVSWLEVDYQEFLRVSWLEVDQYEPAELIVTPGAYSLTGAPVELNYSGGAPAPRGGFVIVDTAPRLWWKRKPKALPEEEAEQQVKRVAGVIERIAREQVANPEPVSVQREQARQAVAPLVRDMPGFDWSAMYRAAIAALIQQRLEEQARLIAAQEIERIRLFEADEDDVLILLMAA